MTAAHLARTVLLPRRDTALHIAYCVAASAWTLCMLLTHHGLANAWQNAVSLTLLGLVAAPLAVYETARLFWFAVAALYLVMILDVIAITRGATPGPRTAAGIGVLAIACAALLAADRWKHHRAARHATTGRR